MVQYDSDLANERQFMEFIAAGEDALRQAERRNTADLFNFNPGQSFMQDRKSPAATASVVWPNFDDNKVLEAEQLIANALNNPNHSVAASKQAQVLGRKILKQLDQNSKAAARLNTKLDQLTRVLNEGFKKVDQRQEVQEGMNSALVALVAIIMGTLVFLAVGSSLSGGRY